MEQSGRRSERSLARQLEQLAQLADHLIVAALLESRGHAGSKMAFQERRFEGLQGALDGIGLLDNVDAVLVFLDHFADAFEVSFDGSQSVQDLFLVALHGRARFGWLLIPTPWGRGLRGLYYSPAPPGKSPQRSSDYADDS